ncbi:NAD(P)H-binding protein [Glycomyces sp. A-F 0318]|uniref:NAD(P)-dependent oxidoreductase n=1 Tax=Glycomyces amatae TaxID=2881355 RepID=UPI001E49E490|nr:NAD(P)H-binding protein [Glycomyces amatae]MCD0446616.1 NAD(P)H-binding protein [Glycomyces amatae]
MKLTVLGATGGTGREVVRQALARGHEVAAVVRDPARLPDDLRAAVTVVVAEATDPQSLAPAVIGSEAVVSVVAPRDQKRPTTVCADAARAAAAAVREAEGGARLVVASNSAHSPGPGDDPFTRYFVKPVILARVLRHANADARRAEELARASGLPWTIARAGMLTDRPGKGRYRSALDRNVPGGFQVTRADFAKALLDAAEDPAAAGRVVSIAN